MSSPNKSSPTKSSSSSPICWTRSYDGMKSYDLRTVHRVSISRSNKLAAALVQGQEETSKDHLTLLILDLQTGSDVKKFSQIVKASPEVDLSSFNSYTRSSDRKASLSWNCDDSLLAVSDPSTGGITIIENGTWQILATISSATIFPQEEKSSPTSATSSSSSPNSSSSKPTSYFALSCDFNPSRKHETELVCCVVNENVTSGSSTLPHSLLCGPRVAMIDVAAPPSKLMKTRSSKARELVNCLPRSSFTSSTFLSQEPDDFNFSDIAFSPCGNFATAVIDIQLRVREFFSEDYHKKKKLTKADKCWINFALVFQIDPKSREFSSVTSCSVDVDVPIVDSCFGSSSLKLSSKSSSSTSSFWPSRRSVWPCQDYNASESAQWTCDSKSLIFLVAQSPPAMFVFDLVFENPQQQGGGGGRVSGGGRNNNNNNNKKLIGTQLTRIVALNNFVKEIGLFMISASPVDRDILCCSCDPYCLRRSQQIDPAAVSAKAVSVENIFYINCKINSVILPRLKEQEERAIKTKKKEEENDGEEESEEEDRQKRAYYCRVGNQVLVSCTKGDSAVAFELQSTKPLSEAKWRCRKIFFLMLNGKSKSEKLQEMASCFNVIYLASKMLDIV